MKNLSSNAVKLLQAIKNKSMWEGDAISVLFPPVAYIATNDTNYTTEEIKAAQIAHWQRDVNLYGQNNSRPVLGSHVDFIATDNYDKTTYEAIKELKAAGLVIAKNGGYNNYSYHYTGK